MKIFSLFLAVILFSSCSLNQKSINRSFNRSLYVANYLNFAFGYNAKADFPKIYQAVFASLNEIPDDVLEKVTNTRHPVLFTVNITTGIARWANSSEVNLAINSEHVFQNGFYLIKLADELENTSDTEAIEGIVLHELAHNYLDHLKKQKFSCDMEREANREVKKWGFEEKFLKAKKMFGSKERGDSPCHDQTATSLP